MSNEITSTMRYALCEKIMQRKGCAYFFVQRRVHSFLATGFGLRRNHDCNHCATNYLTGPPPVQAFFSVLHYNNKYKDIMYTKTNTIRIEVGSGVLVALTL